MASDEPRQQHRAQHAREPGPLAAVEITQARQDAVTTRRVEQRQRRERDEDDVAYCSESVDEAEAELAEARARDGLAEAQRAHDDDEVGDEQQHGRYVDHGREPPRRHDERDREHDLGDRQQRRHLPPHEKSRQAQAREGLGGGLEIRELRDAGDDEHEREEDGRDDQRGVIHAPMISRSAWAEPWARAAPLDFRA